VQREAIAAIATASGGGIGIVRVSGEGAWAVAARVVKPWPLEPESHRMWRATAAGDEILCVAMQGPRTFTGEDVVELHGHGGALSLRKLLRAVFAAGARAAEPGEFTRRAFLNGRLDLTRAEAIAQAVGARTEQALAVAQSHLSGALAELVSRLTGSLVAVLAEVEARVDFPEEELDFAPGCELADRLDCVGSELARLAGTWSRGRWLQAGLTVALVGLSNTGKSSLFNALVGVDRALVDSVPGTTRDYLEAQVDWDGVAVTLIDTAGHRDAPEDLEQRGVALGRARAAAADIRLWVVDATAPVLDGDGDLVVLNKIDAAPDLRVHDASGRPVVAVSALERRGLDRLRAAVLEHVGAHGTGAGELQLATERQHRQILDAREAIVRSEGGLRTDAPPELCAIDLRLALERLQAVLGGDPEAPVLDAIFARFCIGK
jgi:tRNA modification GTPase